MLRLRASLVPCLLALAAAAPVPADPLPEHAVAVVDYDIAVTLDPATKELVGRETIVWRNPDSVPVPDLWFHLYLNAFRSSETTLFREQDGFRRGGGGGGEERWGWTDLSAVRLPDGTDLLPALTFEHPDDPPGEENENDFTVARIVLPEAVPAGGEVTVEVEWKARLPKVHTRTGWAPPEFFLAGQWFPKLGVYEPAGMRGRAEGGWNCHTFHARSEFYADFGSYRVAITLPERFVVNATGRRVEKRSEGEGRVTHVFEQGDVHDFAWSADSSAVEEIATFSATADVSPEEYAEAARRLGRGPEEVALSDVEIRLQLRPEHRAQGPRYIESARRALKTFGLAWGRYPHATLTIIDPPVAGSGAFGMEYPTLITGGTAFLFGYPPFTRLRWVETVTIHEIGHQWWQGLAGSNEFEEAWLDEGFTDFAQYLASEGYGPAGVADLPWLQAGPFDGARFINSRKYRDDAIDTFIWKFSPHSGGFYAYTKPALFLKTLEGVLGEETFARAMRTYAERWRFRHPAGADFRAVVEEVSGRDLGELFEKVVERAGILDPAVVAISSRRVLAPRGHLEDEEAGPDESDAEKSAGGEPELGWRSVVELRQLGDYGLPVEVELRFEGGASERRTWSGDDRWQRWEVVRPERLEEVVVDPDNVYALDVSRINNRMATGPDSLPVTRMALGLLFRMQQLLAGVGL